MFSKRPTIVAGIDVGGPRKGFHAVALRGLDLIGKHSSRSAAEIANWCSIIGAAAVAVDAPCKWRRLQGPAREAERALARIGISSFSTPIEERGRSHPFFRWMVAGHELYAALRPRYPLFDGTNTSSPICLETFPQAVACALAGRVVSAKRKVRIRRELLTHLGLPASEFRNIDEVDAALCAITAERLISGEFKAYGDLRGGFIVVPGTPMRGSEIVRSRFS